jgi:hypothetical protein
MINTDTIRNGWAFASAIHTERASDRSTMSRIVVNSRFADRVEPFHFWWQHMLALHEEAEYTAGNIDVPVGTETEVWTWEVRDLDRLIVLRTSAHFQPVVVGIDEEGRLLGVDDGLPHKSVSYIAGYLADFHDVGELADFKDGVDEQNNITWSVHRVRNGQLIDADAFSAALIA